MSRLLSHVHAHPRLLLSALAGIGAALLLPATYGAVTRSLMGWNLGVWLYLALQGVMMLRSDHARLRQVAAAQAESALTVLVVAIVAAVAGLAGTVVELSAAKLPGAPHALAHVALALSTVVGGWLLLPTLFALTYASRYFHSPQGRGLQFAGADAAFKPDYSDFLYFSFTIAVASQTADVSVTTTTMRRLVLLQSLLSFAFNTAILAFTINIGASMF